MMSKDFWSAFSTALIAKMQARIAELEHTAPEDAATLRVALEAWKKAEVSRIAKDQDLARRRSEDN